MKSPLLTIALVLLLFPLSVSGSEDGQEAAFSYSIRGLFFADAQHPAHSTQNPDNAFLDLYRYSGEIDFRPDFFWDQAAVRAVFKPRVRAAYRWWEDGMPKGTSDSESRIFVNEWRVQAEPLSTTYLSFGKEKLLWGPSFIASPSNILFKNTEKINPKTEVEGKYLAKLIVAPDNALTISLISETQKEDDPFQGTLKPLRLVKADYMGSNYSLSAIGYERQNNPFRLGSYGQWTASDALLLYYDGIVMRGTNALYPVRDPASPLGADLAARNSGSQRVFTTVAAGGAYTFLAGPTLSLEFLYNSQGYNNDEAAEYYRLRSDASDHFFDPALAGLSRLTLAEALDTGLPFLRRYYVMGQLQLREIRNVLDLMLRYVYSLEEHAGQASSIIEWRISDRAQLFNINTVAADRGGQTEFNSLIDKSAVLGIEMHL